MSQVLVNLQILADGAFPGESTTMTPGAIDAVKAGIDEIERLRAELDGVYDCLSDWSAFGFDPATNHLHADDGGAPPSCLLYVPKEL